MRRAGQIYEESRRQEDAFRCYKEGLDFHSALRLLYASRRYEEGVEILQEYESIKTNHSNLLGEWTIPAKDMTVKKLLWSAARMHYKAGDKVKMHCAVDKFVDFESKVKFYMKCGLSGQVVQTLMKAGRDKEAKDMLYDARDYLTAAEITPNDYSFRAECYLLEAARLYQQSATVDNKGKSEELANESWRAFGRVADNMGQGMATLILARVKHSFEELQNSRATFQPRREDCLCGEVETTTQMAMVQLVSDSDFKTAQYTLERAAKLYVCLVSPKSIPDGQKQIEKCLRFYGFREVGTDQYETNDDLFTLWMKRPGFNESSERKSVTRSEALTIITDRTMALLRSVIKQVRSKLRKVIEAGRPCRSFATGYGCAREEPHESHVHPSSEYVIERMKLLERLSLFEMSVVRALEVIQKEKAASKEATQITVKDIGRTVAPIVPLLSELLCPGDGSLSLLFPNKALADRLLHLDYHCKEFIVKLIEKEFLLTNFWKRQSDMNITHRMWILFQSFSRSLDRNPLPRLLVQEEITFNEQLRKRHERDALYRIHRIGALMTPDSPRVKLFVRLWIDAKNMLYRDSDFVRASKTLLRRFLTRPLKVRGCPNPSVSDAITILEMEVLFTLTLAIHLQRPFRLRACCPSSYLDRVQYWNVLVTQDVDWHLKEMRKYKNQGNLLKQVRDLLQYAVDLLIGSVSERFNVLQFALTQEHSLKSGGAERCVTLALVLLINAAIGFTVPALNELRLRKAILEASARARLTPGPGLSARVSSCLDKVRNAVVVGDLVRCLEEMLGVRGEYLVDATINESSQVSYVGTVIDDYYEERPLVRMERDRQEEELSEDDSAAEELLSSIDQQAEDNVDGDALEDDDEIEEEMEHFSEEELQRRAKEENKAMALHLEKQQAARMLLGVLAAALERKRQKSVEIETGEDSSRVLQDRFEKYAVDDHGCTICGVAFKNDDRGLYVASTESREVHELNTKHWIVSKGFREYKDYYCSVVHNVYQSARQFLDGLRKSEEAWIEDRLDLEIYELERELKEFYGIVMDTEKQRRWRDGRSRLSAPLNKLECNWKTLQSSYEEIRQHESLLPEEERSTRDKQSVDASGSRDEFKDASQTISVEDDLPAFDEGYDDVVDDVVLSTKGRNQKKAKKKRRKKVGKK